MLRTRGMAVTLVFCVVFVFVFTRKVNFSASLVLAFCSVLVAMVVGDSL